MSTPFLLNNPIQEYAWGSLTAIPSILGVESSGRPQAELWMGAHPKAPSLLPEGRRLDHWISEAPEARLGEGVVGAFGPRLPYLFKILAAARALSIQAHPDKEQAEAGFAREEAEGIPIDARHRNYRDDNHKPELICALTPFWALNGFRSPEAILSLLADFRITALASLEDALHKADLRGFFRGLMELPEAQKEEALGQASQAPLDTDEARWLHELLGEYPSDIGCLAPLYLHLLQLQPGEALYLDAGTLHAYLDGTGLEIMANSDNVLRGGLTPKHVDVPELLSVLQFVSKPPQILHLQPTDLAQESRYATPTREFALSLIELEPGQRYTGSARSMELHLCLQGQGSLSWGDGALEFRAGISYAIPADAPDYTLEGSAQIYKASVPLEKLGP